MADPTDADFWKRIASNLTFKQLCALNVAPGVEALQMLVSQAMPRLQATGCAVVDYVDSARAEDSFGWFIQQGYVGLQGRRFRTVFVAGGLSRTDVGSQFPEQFVGVAEVLLRAENLPVTLSELTLETASGNGVSFRPGVASSLADDNLLSELAEPLRESGTVHSVTVDLPSGRHMVCDLANRKARGRGGRSQFYLDELLTYGLPLVLDLSAPEERALAALAAQAPPRSVPTPEATSAESPETIAGRPES